MNKIFILSLCIFSIAIYAQQIDSIKIYYLPVVEVISKKAIPFIDKYEYGTDYNSAILNKNGYSLVRRGLNFTQDIYSEGFKRGDIKVVIDGEQYHNACPNRMDAAATRLNILDMSEVELTKSSSLINSGLFGKIEYHRSKLEDVMRIKTLLSGNFGAQNDYDASLSAEANYSNFTLRYSSGNPYENGDKKTFKDLYGYKDNYRYSYINGSFRQSLPEYAIDFGGGFTQAKDISFPYLQMDERNSKVFSGFFSYKGNKIYFNFTDHLMNNGLRTNYSNMKMETLARNFTLGLTGNFYEFIYRNWNADNTINMPMMGHFISNKLMPNVDQFSANFATDYSFGKINTFAKAGAQFFRYKDGSRNNFYKELFPDSKESRFFISAGLIGTYSTQIMNDFILSSSAEIATDAPEAEQLYIAVQRLMSNPDWSGNPTLNQPIRGSIRTSLSYNFIRLEFFGNYVANYIDVVKKMKTMKPVMTYDNVNALIAGTNITISNEWIESNLTYLWGENYDTKKPLAEIAPLSVFTIIRTPTFSGFRLSLSHRYENAQTRINDELKEFRTSAWNSIGVGIEYSINFLTFSLQSNNILNHNYVRYLSYSRSPFSNGVPVFEPGRSISLTISMNKIF
ncbi:MAG: hypothetical protein WHT45_02950 [Ignavibacterium sp.]